MNRRDPADPRYYTLSTLLGSIRDAWSIKRIDLPILVTKIVRYSGLHLLGEEVHIKKKKLTSDM